MKGRENGSPDAGGIPGSGRLPYAPIGAGPAGLATAKNLATGHRLNYPFIDAWEHEPARAEQIRDHLRMLHTVD